MGKTKFASKDFTKASLPVNRVAAFKFAFHNQSKKFFSIGLLLLVGFLPTIICLLIYNSLMSSLYNQYINSINSLTIQTEIESAKSNFQATYIFSTDLLNWILLPCLLIFGITIAGSIRIIRLIYWCEPIFFAEDFIKGIKDNYKHVALCMGICGLLNVLVCHLFLIENLDSYLKAIPLFVTLVIIVPILLLIICQTSIYSESFGKHMILSLSLFFKDLITILPFALLVIHPVLFVALPKVISFSYAIAYPLLAIDMVVFVPYCYGAFFLSCCKSFDKYINKTNYPSLIRKGLR